MSKSSMTGGSLNRRQFIAGGAATGLALSLGTRAALAQDAALKVGFISPRTGPLGGFGQTDGYVLDLARKALEAGIEIGGKKYAVEILDRDTQSDQGPDQQ